MRSRKRYLSLVALSAFALATLPSIASSEPLPVEAINVGGGVYPATHYWSNPQQTVVAGEKVSFHNKSTTVPHGLEFTGGGVSATAICAGLPAAATKPTGDTNWNADCTFGKPGNYTFICTVHPLEMKGTITVPGTVKAKTKLASGENQTEATLNGSVEPEGNVTEYHFQYGTASVSEHSTPAAGLGATDFTSHSVSVLLSALAPETTYHFQLVATYGAGKTTVFGGEQSFTTPPLAPPTATTLAATGLKETEATLNANVDPQGGAKAEYLFEWGLGSVGGSYEHTTTPSGSLPPDGAAHAVLATVNGLVPGTEYHFRVVATNSLGGPIFGNDLKFKSSSSPKPEEPRAEPTPTPPAATTSALTTPPPTIALPEPSAVAPIVGSPSLLSTQRHATSVKGSLSVSRAGAGGRLRVDLLASRNLLSPKSRHPGSVRVGSFVRASVSAGNVTFSVALTAAAKRALALRHRLPLTVRITLTPLSGPSVTVTRSVVVVVRS